MISLGADLVNALRSSASWANLTNLLLQATTLCLAGHLALLLASRTSAAFRHLIAWTALGALVALPLLTAAPKPWASWSLAGGHLGGRCPDARLDAAGERAAGARRGLAGDRSLAAGETTRKAGSRLPDVAHRGS